MFFLRRHILKKNTNPDETRIASLENIRSVTVLLDRSDAQAEECLELAREFISRHGLRGKVFIIDTTGRKPLDKEYTINRRTLTLLGRPNAKMREKLHIVAPDLLICLTTRSNYLVKYLIRTTAARFRIGRTSSLAQSSFNMVFDAPRCPDGESADVFRQMVSVLELIK